MYARKQLLIWTVVIFVLNIVLLAKLRDDAATARTQLEELTPTELTQLDFTNLLESNTVTYSGQETETISYKGQFSEPSQLSLYPENTAAGSVEVYYVHKGDTLWQISKRHNLDLRTLLTYNNLKDPNLIRPGQRIEIPRRHINMQVSP